MFVKVYQTKHVIEIYEYEHLNIKPDFDPDRADKGESENAIENYKMRNQIRRDMIRRLAIENFETNDDKFVTLTFRDNPNLDITDVKACNAEFKKFILRLKRRITKSVGSSEYQLKYLAVIEFQKRGAVHYHMLINLPYIKQKSLESVWGLGYVFINAINHVDNLGAYVIKYMTPDTEDPRLMGLKAYNCSKHLERPNLIKSWDLDPDVDLQSFLDSLPKENVVYRAKYTTERSGRIAYSQVNLKRKLAK